MNYIKGFCLLFFLMGVSCTTKKDVTQNKKVAINNTPNIIFILTDDLGYADISSYGATKVATPHIDALAEKGAKFTNFHTSASICTPSRGAFLTGAYPQRNGVYMGLNEHRPAHWFLGLNPNEITIAEQMKRKNYQTLMVGKWHLGTQEPFLYYNQGFDNFYGMRSNYDHNSQFFDETKVIYEDTPLDQLTTLYTNKITSYIDTHKDKPFFIYFAHNYPHRPYKPSKKFKGSSKDGDRGDIIQEMDWGIGEIVKSLENNNLLSNTVIIFSSDNGAPSERHVTPFRGNKRFTLEGGHRVPFIIYWPDKIKPNVFNESVTAMDLFPTLSDMVGVSLPEDRIYDGQSLFPLVSGKAKTIKGPEYIYYYNGENLQAIKYGDYKLHLSRNKTQVPHWDRLEEFLDIEAPVLYNISSDPSENINIADQHPKLVQTLLKEADNIRAKLGEYNARGTEQRATGNLFPNVPVITHMKDWDVLEDELKKEAEIANTNRAKQ